MKRNVMETARDEQHDRAQHRFHDIAFHMLFLVPSRAHSGGCQGL
jgi:hypothetical protein